MAIALGSPPPPICLQAAVPVPTAARDAKANDAHSTAKVKTVGRIAKGRNVPKIVEVPNAATLALAWIAPKAARARTALDFGTQTAVLAQPNQTKIAARTLCSGTAKCQTLRVANGPNLMDVRRSTPPCRPHPQLQHQRQHQPQHLRCQAHLML